MLRVPILLVLGLLFWMLHASIQPVPSRTYSITFHGASSLLRDAPVEETLRRWPGYSVNDYRGAKDSLGYRVYTGLQMLGVDVKRQSFKAAYSKFQKMHDLPNSDGVIDKRTIEVLDRELSKLELTDKNEVAVLKDQFPSLRFLPGSTYSKFDDPKYEPVEHHKSVIYRALKLLPEKHTKGIRDLTLYYTKKGHRGLGGGNKIILKALGVSDEELSSVFVHEMGHIVDTGIRKGVAASGDSGFRDGRMVVPADDPSVAFYSISWVNNRTKKKGAGDDDFVSGYAKSDPFEDFAESYVMYVMQGEEFRFWAKYNDVLREKYSYLQNNVFDGNEFKSGFKPKKYTSERYWDVTVRPVFFFESELANKEKEEIIVDRVEVG